MFLISEITLLIITIVKASFYVLFFISLQYNSIQMAQEIYMVDKNGRRIAVQVPLKRYLKLVADSQELEDIKLYRKVKSSKRKAIPFDEAFREIEESKK